MTDNVLIEKEKDSLQIIIFTIGDKKYGMDISKCRDVNKNINITRVPKSKDYISGIVNIRGEIVTVIELAKLAGYTDQINYDKTVVIRVKKGGQKEAIRADNIIDVVEIPRNSLEKAHHYLTEKETRFIDFVTLVNKQLILLVDPDQVFDPITIAKIKNS